MKKIEAIIRRERLSAVRKALDKAGYNGMTITEVRGHGRQKGRTRQMTDEEYRGEFLPKLKLEIVVPEEDVSPFIEAIISSARTGDIGDGKIFVSPLETVVRVRTGEEGNTAI